MKPISEMNDQEKSVMLLTISGLLHDSRDDNWFTPNLYFSEHMALAQKVLIWAHDHRDDLKMSVKGESALAWFFAYTSGAETALDGVLSLAIEAGMFEDTVVSQEESE